MITISWSVHSMLTTFGALALALAMIVGAAARHTRGTTEYCDLSCEYNGQEPIKHTVCAREKEKCGKDPACGPDFKVIYLNNNDRQYILDIHNYLRNKVAMGREKRGPQPSASNMNTLVYNKELEFIAQCWINTCHKEVLVHDKCRRTAKYDWVGQNLAYMGSTDPKELDKVALLKKLTLGWYDEVEFYDPSWVQSHQQRDVMIGHYTQLVWADTREVGCAMSYYSFDEGDYRWYNMKLACNYGSGGNYLDQAVYKIGKPATNCAGRGQNKKYPGLCGAEVSLNQTKGYTNAFYKYSN